MFLRSTSATEMISEAESASVPAAPEPPLSSSSQLFDSIINAPKLLVQVLQLEPDGADLSRSEPDF